MKTRHLVLGLAAVLTVSLAVPAFGGSIGFRPGGSVRLTSLVRKALKTTSSTQSLAADAQVQAAAAKDMAGGAEATAAAGKAAASEALGMTGETKGGVDEVRSAAGAAQGVAAAAQSTAQDARRTVNGAQGTADNAVSTATQTAARLATVEALARNALSVAQGKVGRTIQVFGQGRTVRDGTSGYLIKEGNAQCPPTSFLSGGGYALVNKFSTVPVNEPEGNAWVVQAAVKGDGPLTVWATCVEP